MTQELEKKAVELIDQFGTKLGQLAEKYGPEVVEAGLNVARISGIQNIIIGFLLGVVAFVGYKIAR